MYDAGLEQETGPYADVRNCGCGTARRLTARAGKLPVNLLPATLTHEA